VSQYQKGKTDLDFLKQETVSDSGISCAVCKSAPCSRQITTPAQHPTTVFTGGMLFQPTALKAMFGILYRTINRAAKLHIFLAETQ